MKPAPLAARAAAVLLDGLVTFFALGVAVSLVTGGAGTSDGALGFRLQGWPAVLWGVLSWGYWIVLEHRFGTTLGKRLFGIRVVGPDGGPPSLGRSAARNVLRVVDGAPYVVPYLLGFAVAALDPERRRLGDRAAGTRVVSGSPTP